MLVITELKWEPISEVVEGKGFALADENGTLCDRGVRKGGQFIRWSL